jgi:uncharacterized YigZ family protein
MFDHFQTIESPSEAVTKVQRSVFRALAFPLDGEEDFGPALERVQKQYFDATHHCWAYRLVDAGGDTRARSADAGEPAGTAGKPILGAIESAALFNVAVIVIRHYGGVKLGTGGLVRAYREAAAEALVAAKRSDRYMYERLSLTVPFDAVNAIYRMIAPPDVVLIDQQYGDSTEFTIDVRKSQVGAIEGQLTEKRIPLRRVR